MLLGLVIAHGVQTLAGVELGTASTEGGVCITAISLSPIAESGDAQIFEARYAHCEGAAAFRVVQLWVGDEVTPTTPRLNLGFENGMFSLEGGGACAPGDPVVLTSTYGAFDCATSTATPSGNEMIVQWSLSFDVDAFAGSHGVYFDAKGGTGDPEPRLEWTLMGTYTVEAAAEATGSADESDGGETSSDTSTTDIAPGESSGAIATTGTDDGGLPGASPRRRGGPGCTCATGADSSTALLGLALLWIRRRRRPLPMT